MPGLPPLHALRAFEATARHLSMKDAAAELAVTPGAVSQLVRTLEDRLGIRLFHRNSRSLVLTEAGQAYFIPIRHAFRQIREATRRLEASRGLLTVSAPPAFAAAWLMPRLGRFRAQHPDIEIAISTTRSLANFVIDGVDLAIRHGLGRYPGLACDRIATIAMIPVCSPAFLAALPHPPAQPADLLGLALLHDAERQDWPQWFQANGIADIGSAAHAGVSVDDQLLLIQAAVADQGVALVTETLVRRELQRGTLVRALDVAWPQEFAYWLVYPRASAEQPKIAAFRAWLVEEGRRIRQPARPARRAAPAHMT